MTPRQHAAILRRHGQNTRDGLALAGPSCNDTVITVQSLIDFLALFCEGLADQYEQEAKREDFVEEEATGKPPRAHPWKDFPQ